MPGLGTLEAAQAASLAGRASVRRALYMPALAAARFNPDMQAKYVKLAAAGKPAKAALAAIMRKLLLPASALLKSGSAWTTNLA